VRPFEDGYKVWGGAIKLPDEKLMPVYCYDKKDSCGFIEESKCQQGPCAYTDECYYDGYCYYIENTCKSLNMQ
jgi:hypothetical protein